MKDIKRLEERNKVLIDSVRRNIDKIDKIVSRLSTVSREGSRQACKSDLNHQNSRAARNAVATGSSSSKLN